MKFPDDMLDHIPDDAKTSHELRVEAWKILVKSRGSEPAAKIAEGYRLYRQWFGDLMSDAEKMVAELNDKLILEKRKRRMESE